MADDTVTINIDAVDKATNVVNGLGNSFMGLSSSLIGPIAGITSLSAVFTGLVEIERQNIQLAAEEQTSFVTNQLLVNGVCLKIRQSEGEIWEFPQLLRS